MHGISRNAEKQARYFYRLAKQYGVTVIAPLFNDVHFPDYQRLGIKGGRADLALKAVLEDVTQRTGIQTTRIAMFGYSGGGQFVHRYAMAYPHQVTAIAIGAAGWYTFPDASRHYPYGAAPHRKLPGVTFNPAAFLRVPACVMVGVLDVKRDNALRRTEKLDRQQGLNRIERAQRWVDAMRRASRQLGFTTEYRFVLLPQSDHSFTRCVKAGGLDQAVFKHLFDPPANSPCTLHQRAARELTFPHSPQCS